ncbi:aminodeoxychorismate synthase component I [Parahaliea mediterranea]|uniref:aminodeoxychorismate synthase component I n=1 Tax=Parahaliea mediterranea TaxID=651086 RepID=UPI000E2ED967|nr:aminodeoxychorismate synthase component I [Parahaliea mediterranea]
MPEFALKREEVPYFSDVCDLFKRLRDLPDAALLDSSHGAPRAGRFDIVVARAAADSPPVLTGAAQDGASVRRHLGELQTYQRQRYRGIGAQDADLPFCGGLLGYISYDAGALLHGITPASAGEQPLVALRAYDACIIQDHLLQRSTLVNLPALPAPWRADLLARLRQPPAAHEDAFTLLGRFQSRLGEQGYRRAFGRIADYIRAGDCYQVNLAQCFSAPYRGEPFAAYRALRRMAGAPFSGYVQQGDGALLCLSPERFLSLRGRHVETRPIKGTRPRLDDPAADAAMASELRHSPKDRAENLMIVDLLRNDLGQSCLPGSIGVDALFEVESYPTVHHLVSAISGELAPGRDALDLLRDAFPGGSITGAPKRRAMQIIAELENTPRQAYCGSLLYISADGRMDSNIAIRSLLMNGTEVRCWGGGGIVADSDCAAEHSETLDKVGRFLNCLETEFSPT